MLESVEFFYTLEIILREFGGITDIQGKFVYSWTIGNKGDIDTLAIEAEISSPGVAVSKAVSSFDIVE
jgi:hypothetical protein